LKWRTETERNLWPCSKNKDEEGSREIGKNEICGEKKK